jgi:hypothetical protein
MLLLAWLAIPAPLPAQTGTDFLKVVPDDVLGFAFVRNIGETSAKIEALAKLVNAPLPGAPLATIKQSVGIDKGLDEKGTALAVVLPGDGDPIAILMVPVTDYKAFITPLKPKSTDGSITEAEGPDGKIWIGKKGSYAAMSGPTTKSALEKVINAKKDVTANVQPLQGWLASNDAAIVLTNNGVKVVVAKMRDGLKQAKDAVANAPAEAKFLTDIIQALDGTLKSADTDVTHVTLGVQIDQGSNVNLTTRALFAKGSSLAKSAGGVKPLDGGPLTGLPAGLFVMAGGGVFSEGTSQSLMNMSFQITKSVAKDLPKEKLEKLEKEYSQMSKGIRGMSTVWQAGKANDPIFAGVMGVVKVDDAKAYLANYEKGIAAMNELLKGSDAPLPSYEIKRVDVGGSSALELTMDMAKALPPGGDPNQKQIMEMMFGKGGKMMVSMVAADANTVLMRYTPATEIKEFLDTYKKKAAGLAADPDLAKVTGQLPANAQWAIYFSPQGLVGFAGRMLNAILGQQLPPFPKTPPVGMAVKLSDAGLEGQLVIPASVLDGIGKFAKKVGTEAQ